MKTGLGHPKHLGAASPNNHNDLVAHLDQCGYEKASGACTLGFRNPLSNHLACGHETCIERRWQRSKFAALLPTRLRLLFPQEFGPPLCLWDPLEKTKLSIVGSAFGDASAFRST